MDIPTTEFHAWDGAWPEEVLFPFLAITSEEAIKATEAGQYYDRSGIPLDALANPQNARAKRIATHLTNYRAHSGYKRLSMDERWKAANRMRAELAQRNPLFGEPFGEIRLAHAVAGVAGLFNPRFVPKRATLADQRKVLAAATKLHAVMKPGAQLEGKDQHALRLRLQDLVQKMDQSIRAAETSGTRPHRGDQDAARRYWLVTFCKQLMDRFGEAPRAIVREVAAMLDYEIDDTTAGRYVERATHPRPPVVWRQITPKKAS